MHTRNIALLRHREGDIRDEASFKGRRGLGVQSTRNERQHFKEDIWEEIAIASEAVIHQFRF